MRLRRIESVWVLAGVFVVGLMAAGPAAGQAASADAKTGSALRTPWGDPDLQGIWNIETITPLERPEEFAGKETLTVEEAAELEQRVANRRVDGPPRAGDPGTYNQFWFDRGTKVVGSMRTSLIVDPPDGRIPWIPEARDQLAARAEVRQALLEGQTSHRSFTDLDTGERCLTDGLTMFPAQGYNMNYHVFQSPGYVVIQHEMFHDFRVIPLDGRPHVGPQINQWLGDARGRWEGDTLVVETTNFAGKTHYSWAQGWRASRPTMRLVERFTRLDDETIDYQFTMEDPSMFTTPWTAAVPMSTNQEARGVAAGILYEYACHEGNYAMTNVLGGARARDIAAASR